MIHRQSAHSGRLLVALTVSAIAIIGALCVVLNQRVQAAANLVAAYSFDETSGATVNDASGMGNTGTITNALRTTGGKNGGALKFDGNGDWVTVGDSASLDLTSRMTIEAWVKPVDLQNWTTIAMKERPGGLSYALYGSDNTNKPPAIYGHLGGDREAAGTSVLPLNTWSHVAGTYDGAYLKLYVNGNLVRSSPHTGSMTTSSSPLRIGGNTVWGEYFNGVMDDVRIYAAALTQTEIQTDMNTSVNPPASDTTAPTVTITSPAEGAAVSGTVTLTANATDNMAVAGVQFFVNGAAVGAEDTAAPYSASWNTASLTAGNYSVTARARDAAGNTTLSTAVNAKITGDFSFSVQQPTLTLPSNGEGVYAIDIAYLNGFTTSGIDLWAKDVPAGVSGRFLFDPMVHQGTTEFIVTTSGIADGTYTFTVGATDLGGTNISHSQVVTLIIDNTPDFALSATPQTQNVTSGGSVDYTLSVSSVNNFASSVSFSASGLPAGASAIFTPTSLTPPGTAMMRIGTSASTPSGQYTVTVSGTSGGLTRSTKVVVNVTSSTATWNVGIMGSTGTQNNTVRVGKVRTDGLNRVYVGTIGTGRVLEHSWNGTSWGGGVDVGGSPTNEEIHDMTIGDGRGDGQDRIYAASYDKKVYEIWHDGTAWRQVAVATLNNLGMHAAVGDGRGDGVNRLYLVSTSTLYEYTWNGSAWVGGEIGSTPGAHGAIVASPRGTGQKGVYVASISSGSFEARWNGSSWSVVSMGDSGDVRGIYAGNGRNDGVNRVYGALLDGRIREYSWNGNDWSIVNTTAVPGGLIHSYVLPGRNDGVNRIYASSANGKVYEYTWTGSAWSAPINMGGGSDYMYGQHFGDGRNDGITRVYSADRGSVNRVYEYTWSASVADTQAPTAPVNLTGTGGLGVASLSWGAATDNIGVVRYNIHRSSTAGFTPSTTNKVGDTTSLSFSESGLTAGTYYYRVTAQDGTGNISQPSNEVSVVVTSDTESPTVVLTSPGSGATLSGTVTVAANASDNGGIAGVTFLIDGAVVGNEDTTSPYSFAWNTLTATNGSHTLTARARDNAGNTTLSAAVTVTVNNSTSAGLVASFGFNEGTGSVVADGAGGDNNGTISNALWSTAGRYGNALSFDGSGDWVTVSDAANLDLTNGMTLEAWVRPGSLSGWTTALLKENGSTLSYALYASDNTGQPPAGYIQLGGDQSVRGSSALALGTWVHLATTFDGSFLRLYVNGVEVASRSLTGSISTSTGALRIGGNAVWGEYFNGLIDEVRIYNRALTQTEIQTDMNTPL